MINIFTIKNFINTYKKNLFSVKNLQIKNLVKNMTKCH